MNIGIKGLAYAFDAVRGIETLPILAGDPAALAAYRRGGHHEFGYSDRSLSELAVSSARQSLRAADLAASSLDAIVIGCASIRFWPKYAELLSTEIMNGLGLQNVPSFGVTMGGCANYASALRIAKSLIAENGWRNVLIVETNKMPSDDMRPYMPYVSIFGDASVSTIVSTEKSDFSIAGMAQIAKPFENATLGDPRFLTNNIAGYRHVIGAALDAARCTRADIDAVIPNNKNVAELAQLADFWGVPFSKVFTDNIGRIGHLWSADNLINLNDLCATPVGQAHGTFLLLCQGDAGYAAIVLRRSCEREGTCSRP